jgi:hypothetical protein
MSLTHILGIAGVSTLVTLLLGFVTMCPRTAGRWLRWRRDAPEIVEEMPPLQRRPGPPAPADPDLRYIG